MSVAIKENKVQTRVVKAKRLTPVEKIKIKKVWNDIKNAILADDVAVALYLSNRFKQPRKKIDNLIKEFKNDEK